VRPAGRTLGQRRNGELCAANRHVIHPRAQGAAIGRAGEVYITTDDAGAVWVGGEVAICITGTVEL
jgi:predicted PhzF superfamily epimerase YddE/YHI9